MKGTTGKSVITAGNFTIPLLVIQRISTQKISKDREDSALSTNLTYLIFIDSSTQHRRIHNLFKYTWHIYQKKTLFWSIKKDLNTWIRTEIIQMMLSYHKINQKSLTKRYLKNPQTLLNNTWFKRKSKGKFLNISNCIKMETQHNENLWDMARSVLRRNL